MDCVVTGGNVKGSGKYPPSISSQIEQRSTKCVCAPVFVCVYRSVLAKAIYSLSRIGDDLYVEPQEDGVSSGINTLKLPLWMHTVSVLPVCLHTLRQSSILLTFSLSFCHSSRCGLWTPPGRHMLASCLHRFFSAGADYFVVFFVQVTVECVYETRSVVFVQARNI